MARNNSFEEFVRIWQAAENVQAVADHFKVSRHAVERTAGQLRKAGVEIKNMRRNPLREELTAEKVAELNAMVKKS